MKYSVFYISLAIWWLQACTSENTGSSIVESEQSTFTEEQFTSANLSFVTPVSYNFGESIKVTGFIDVPPEGRATISPYYGGYVKQISLLPGQQVKKSEVLLILEHPDYIMMQRDYIQAKEELAYLRDDFERQKILLAENINSKKSYLKAESEFRQTEAKYKALKEQLQMLGFNIQAVETGKFSTEVRLFSPIDGFVTEVYAVKGQYLQAASKAVDLINTEHLHLELNVFEKDLPSVKEDQQVMVYMPGISEPLSARIYLVGKEITGAERTARVHAHLDEEVNVSLSPGMFLESEILISSDWRQAIPNELVRDGEIWITQSQSWPVQVEKLAIKTGLNKNNFIELTDSLKEDYRIIKGLR